MTGILLIVFGLLSLGSGIYIYVKNNKLELAVNSKMDLQQIIEMAIADGVITENERKIIKKLAIENNLIYEEVISQAEQQMWESSIDSETELIDYDKRNGDDFEKFIVKKFNTKYYTVKEWAGDKYVDGIYADTTQQPDLRMELKLKYNTIEFSVECKWRKKLPYGGIKFAYKEQFKRYKEYEKTQNIPVFIAIGIGGKGLSPESFFVIPLRELESNFIPYKILMKNKRKIDGDFFFDIKTKELK